MATIKPATFRAGNSVCLVKDTGIIGKIIDVRDTTVGQFISVNFGDKKNPKVKQLRPAAIQKV